MGGFTLADKAYRILSPDTSEIVYATDLCEENRTSEYRCVGNVDGIHCTAKMELVISNVHKNYFRSRPGSQHIKGCKYDKTGYLKILQSLDLIGKSGSVDALLRKLLFDSNNHSRSSAEQINSECNTSPAIPSKDDERPLFQKKRPPVSLQELYFLLFSKDPLDSYSGYLVNDLLIDHRNVSLYRKNGLQNNQTTIVICDKVSPKNAPEYATKQLSPQDLILAAGFDFEDHSKQKLYFLIQPTPKARDTIFHAFKLGKKVAVFAKWQFCGSNSISKCYRAITAGVSIGEKCILPLDQNDLN